MSMNKTCPISNFTSEEYSDGIGFVLSRNSRFNESISAHRPFTSAFARLPSSSDSAVTSRRDKPALDRGSLGSFFLGNHLLHRASKRGSPRSGSQSGLSFSSP